MVRNLQDNQEKIQIIGDSFTEISSSNAIIYIDNEKVDFKKSVNINANKDIKVEIELLSNIKIFKEMFKGCKRLKEITLKNIDTNKITDTTSMFQDCTGLTVVKFENMNMNNIASTSKMFQKCSNLNNIHINNLSTDKTKDMSQMFEGCSNLRNISFISKMST